MDYDILVTIVDDTLHIGVEDNLVPYSSSVWENDDIDSYFGLSFDNILTDYINIILCDVSRAGHSGFVSHITQCRDSMEYDQESYGVIYVSEFYNIVMIDVDSYIGIEEVRSLKNLESISCRGIIQQGELIDPSFLRCSEVYID